MRNERPILPPNILKLLRNCSLFVGTESRSLTLKTTVSKKMNRRNRSQEKNKRSRSQKAGKQKSRKNSPLLTNQRTHLRNESEFSPKRFLDENSDKGVSAQYLRPNIHPIYHELIMLAAQIVERPWILEIMTRIVHKADECLAIGPRLVTLDIYDELFPNPCIA